MELHVHYHTDLKAKILDVLRGNLESGIHLTAGTGIPENPEYQVLINGTPDPYHLTASSSLQALIIPYAGVPFDPDLGLMLDLQAGYLFLKFLGAGVSFKSAFTGEAAMSRSCSTSA